MEPSFFFDWVGDGGLVASSDAGDSFSHPHRPSDHFFARSPADLLDEVRHTKSTSLPFQVRPKLHRLAAAAAPLKISSSAW